MSTVRPETPRPNRKRVYVLETTIHPLLTVLKCTVVWVCVIIMYLTQGGGVLPDTCFLEMYRMGMSESCGSSMLCSRENRFICEA